MNSQFKDTYERYESRSMSASGFKEFRSELDNITDDELWNVMMIMDEQDRERNIAHQCMSSAEKSKILQKIHGYIVRSKCLSVFKYAAAVAFVAIVGSGIYFSVRTPERTDLLTTYVKAGSKSETVLPDGTRVQLNGASSIAYEYNDRGVRSVSLTGEGFFDVAKDPHRPFRVKVGDICIEVLGTTFNINAYDPDMIETSLLTGSISIYGESLSRKYILLPGEKAIYRKGASKLMIAKADSHVSTGWLDDYLVFDSEPLSQVILKIERWYGVKIEMRRDTLGADKLSGSFLRESIDNVMRSLSIQYKFNYEIDKDYIIIY